MTRPQDDPNLHAVIGQLHAGGRDLLGENLVGFYLHGSLTVGDFDEHSDVDFVFAVRRDITDAELPAFQAFHERIYALPCPWAQHLEGTYLTLDFLRRYDPAWPLHWFLDHGSRQLVRSDHDNTVLLRHTLLRHGLPLAGPSPRELIDSIPPADLRRNMSAFLTGWYTSLASDPRQFTSRWLQMYVVVSLCRVLYTLQTAQVTSKASAVAWAMEDMPQWKGLIERAWQDRPDPATKCRLPADPAEVAQTMAFCREAIAQA